MDEKITSIIDEIKLPFVEIKNDRNYWLVRTQSGEYYDEFYHDNFIAIGWDEFSDIEIFQKTEKSILVKQIDKLYPENKQPGLIYNQIYRFLFEMKPGDVVMIPTHNSQHISFGIIDTHPYIDDISETSIGEGACPYLKRRKVKWLKTVKRTQLDPYLYRMMQSHHTINNANDYAHFIDRTLHSFFIKGDTSYLVIPVNKEGKIPATDLIDFVNNMLDLVPLINELDISENKYNRKDVDLKAVVQSPGIIEFSSYIPWVIVGMGLLLVFGVGGKFKAIITKEKSDIEASSTGILGILLNFVKHKNQHELEKMALEHKIAMEKIKAEIPRELKNLLDSENQEDQ